MIADAIVSRLQGVRATGKGRWIACCPAHEDRSPSLSIHETQDGTVLLHCFAGCSCEEVAAAVGFDLADLFPPTDDKRTPKERREFFAAADVLRCISHEAGIVAGTVAHFHKVGNVSQDERARLMTAWNRINHALEYAGVRG